MISEELAQEVGDTNFPLEVFTSDPNTDHEHVGLEAEVAPHANEVMEDVRGETGEILGVYEKSGQIAGYKARINGETYIAPKKDFYVGNRGFVEDVHLDTDRAQHVKRVLDHFSTQHDYHGPSWEGVELFCFELAKAADRCAIESAGWYNYSHSTRADADGKDWRYVVPDQGQKSVVVNCHSILHDDVWTLATTTHSTTEADESELDFIGSDHHWARALAWTIRTAKALGTHGFDYSRPIKKYKRRLAQTAAAQRIGNRALKCAGEIYEAETGNKPNLDVQFGVSPVFVPAGKIAEHRGPTDEVSHSVVTIHPENVANGMLETVVKHEAVHGVINDRSEKPHGDLFQRIGRKMGLADRHMD